MKIRINQTRSAAFKYVRMGWSIIPSRLKNPLISWKEFQSRQASKTELKQWFRKWRKPNLALVLGKLSGVIALDIDSTGGFEALDKLQERFGKLPRTPKVKTGKGVHYYFKHPGRYVKHGELAPGLEIKGDASLITLPPSVHPSGNPYKWLIHPDECKIADAPEWLLKYAQEKIKSPEQTVYEGNRNETLASFAGLLRSRGANEQDLLEVLKSVNQVLCSPPLGEGELTAIAKSIGKYPSKYDSAAPTYISAAEKKWITAKELLGRADEVVDWIWHGFVGLGMVSILSARPKVGKTTLLFQLLKAVLSGEPFLEFPTRSVGKILLFTEEPLSLLKRRIDKLGLGQNRFLIMAKYDMDPLRCWDETIAYIKRMTEEEGVKFVIVDTVAAFWKVENENDASHVKEALDTLQGVIRKNKAALLLIHHLRKADGDEGTAIRGSGQLFAMVEVGMELTRMPGGESRRQFISQGRYEESQQEIAIDLTDDGYHSLGSVDRLMFNDVKKRILAVIPEEGRGEAVEENNVKDALDDPKPGKTNLRKALAQLTEEGKIIRKGKGVKGNPYKYTKRPPFNFNTKIARRNSA